MNTIQKNWLLETFFKNEKFAGWKNIAEKLIEEGSCITTNQGDSIWVGGIGNFISSENYDGGVDLIKLTFDVKEFVSKDNKFFLEYYNNTLNAIKNQESDLQRYAVSIRTLTKF